jgi:PEP-CTERM motif
VKATFPGWLVRSSVVAAIAFAATPAQAAKIDFETLNGVPLTGPPLFQAIPPQTLDFLNVDASGVDVRVQNGMILTKAFDVPANVTSAYGTACFGGCDTPNFLNPIVVEFSEPIDNFFVDVFSGFTRDGLFRVSDDLGHSATFFLPPGVDSGWTQIGFAAAGQKVFIEQLTLGNEAIEGLRYDFFIDNIHFDEPLPPLHPVPEPATMVLLGSGLVSGAMARRRRRYTSAK